MHDKPPSNLAIRKEDEEISLKTRNKLLCLHDEVEGNIEDRNDKLGT